MIAILKAERFGKQFQKFYVFKIEDYLDVIIVDGKKVVEKKGYQRRQYDNGWKKINQK
jgi:hypothetical protein